MALPGVRISALPHYIGPAQFCIRALSLREKLLDIAKSSEALIIRAPSTAANIITSTLTNSRRPFAVEVVGDPHSVFGGGAVRHPLRLLFRWWFARHLRRQCWAACAAAYVTEGVLQRRYPPGPYTYATWYSSVDLPRESLAAAPRAPAHDGVLRLVFVGSLEQHYKGLDVLLLAVRTLVGGGLDVRLCVLGDGRERPRLVALAGEFGLTDRVVFDGQVSPRAEVEARFDRADLLVMPSRTEGLPRAMIEAMARGLPCIGSSVGGIPELLPPEDLVPPGDAEALAKKIQEVLEDPARMARMSARNLEKAREYRDDVLAARRTAFYQVVRERTEAWLREGRGR
ncbi:MAG: glycosyltransferase family 4 protein [Deferrisomatales bacterium]